MLQHPKRNRMSTNVRKLRVERGWTQEHLSRLTGLSVRSIQRIERGQSCSLETQNALAAVFEIERSAFQPVDASSAEVETPPVDLEAVAYVKGLRGFLSHALLFGVCAAVGLVTGLPQPAMFWCLLGWGMGLLAHGIAAFGFLNIFSSEWERQQIEKRLRKSPPIELFKKWLDRQLSTAVLRGFSNYGRVSMKIVAKLSGSVSLLAGVALLAWLSYDATNVMQTLGLQARMDEAGVALATLLLGSVLVATGMLIWRRVLRPSRSVAA